MRDLLEEWLGTIAVLIYLLYPVLKRWLDRRKQKAEARKKQTEAGAGTEAEAPEGVKAPPVPKHKPARQPAARKVSRRALKEERRRAAELEVLAELQGRLARLSKKTQTLVRYSDRATEVKHFARPLREQVLGPLGEIERSLGGSPDGAQLVAMAEQLRELEVVFGNLEAAVEQRLGGIAASLIQGDRIAEACYRPFLGFARSHRLRLPERLVITAKARVGQPPIRISGVVLIPLPAGFERDVRSWPSIAYEVSQDLYRSIDHLEGDLHQRLGLPRQVPAPSVEMELDGTFIRYMFGAWLSEIFSDVLGTVMLGPAYGEMLRHHLRDRSAPHRTAAVLAHNGLIDRHPPARLRLYIASRVLRHLGRDEEGDRLWQQWQDEHPEVSFFYLPLGGQWVGVPDETLTRIANSLVDTLLKEPWPELAGFHLMSIPGLAYSHAEHAEVNELIPALIEGVGVDADARWIVAAAVLATVDAPSAKSEILRAARESLSSLGMPVGVEEPEAATTTPRRNLGPELRRSVRDPSSLREAIILGALLGRRRPREPRRTRFPRSSEP